jgi:ring-1,2-phenylacetyl-CoA epoxidase subunit PaaC
MSRPNLAPDLQAPLAAWLLARADDELILAHRNSEWTGHAPILEEDIALANIAQDELGHARLWYEIHHGLTGADPDRLVFFRDAAAYRCTWFVALPRGDWALTLLRQYLFDTAEALALAPLESSGYQPLADAAAKVRREELYHVRHSAAWVRRLGRGTPESHARTQAALDQLWGYALQLFVPQPGDAALVAAGLVPDALALRGAWEAQVRPFLTTAGLTVPDVDRPLATARTTFAPDLPALLAEMQEVARWDPQAEW